VDLLAVFIKGPVGLRAARVASTRGVFLSLSRRRRARCGVFAAPALVLWVAGGAARGAFLTRRTLGSFLMRRGGISMNGLLFVCCGTTKVLGHFQHFAKDGFMRRRSILCRVRVWTGDSKATTFCSGAACLLVSYRPLALAC
jgi:hypothetical protein